MSAIRGHSNRNEIRKQRSAPYYARSVVRTVYKFLGWKVTDDDNGSLELPKDSSDRITNATIQTASSSIKHVQDPNNYEAAPQQHANFNRPPLKSVEPVNLRSQDPISSDTPCTRPLPNGRMDTDTPENSVSFQFRFGTNSPSFSSTNPNLQTGTPSSTPRKKLTRNPNGTYRWEGAGSAKHARSRNRYASPAFGVSPSKSERVVLKDSFGSGETPLSDSKRRKVNEEGSTNSHPFVSDSPNNPVPFPISSSSPTTPRTNGNTARTTTISSSSRLRTPAKPTAPVVPSPLRQAWSDASSSSSRDDTRQSPSQPSKQTKTANFMAGLIKETSPPKKPDLSNPYQSASPVGKVGPPRRGTKRPRASGKPSAPGKNEATDDKKAKEEEKEKEKLKDYSPQAIIEATVPKGSKRSRPPAHFEKRTSSPEETLEPLPTQRETLVVVETRKVTYVVEEPDLDEEEARRSTKKVKPTVNGYGPPPSVKQKTSTSPPTDSDVTVEEVDVAMQGTETEGAKELPKLTTQINSNGSATLGTASSPTSRSSFSAFKPNSIPKEPSKLRYSFQAEVSSTASSPASSSTPLPRATPSPLPKSDFKFSPPSSDFTFKVDDKATSPKSQPQPLEAESDEKNLKTVIKTQVRAMNAVSLPVFTFTATGTSVFPNTSDHVKARSDVKALSKTTLPTFDFGSETSAVPFTFNYDPTKSTQGTHTFNPPKQIKPFVFGEGLPTTAFTPPKPTPPFVPVKGFDFAAAGMKVPTVVKDTKACSLCGLSSPAAASKCSTCEEPFSASPAPPIPVKGFDFAAAGMKVPTVVKDTKACSLCGLSSPATASKCSTCDEPFSASPAPPIPPKGFDFAAAGMKVPTVGKDTKACSLCGLSSPATASKCSTCEEPFSASPAPPVKGFDFAAAGMKPPTASKDTWSCSSCALSSPATAKECVVCGEPKP